MPITPGALEQTRTLATPLATCEAVLTEAYHLLGRAPHARSSMLRWIDLGRVKIPFHFDEQGLGDYPFAGELCGSANGFCRCMRGSDG